MANVLKATEDMHKTLEQLEEERIYKLEERIPRMRLDGMRQRELVSTVEKFYNQLIATTFLLYDLGERQLRQKYDVIHFKNNLLFFTKLNQFF